MSQFNRLYNMIYVLKNILQSTLCHAYYSIIDSDMYSVNINIYCTTYNFSLCLVCPCVTKCCNTWINLQCNMSNKYTLHLKIIIISLLVSLWLQIVANVIKNNPFFLLFSYLYCVYQKLFAKFVLLMFVGHAMDYTNRCNAKTNLISIVCGNVLNCFAASARCVCLDKLKWSSSTVLISGAKHWWWWWSPLWKFLEKKSSYRSLDTRVLIKNIFQRCL